MPTRKNRRLEQSMTPDRREERVPIGQRAAQRDTAEQLEGDPHPARPDEPTAWERELQYRLPPRGDASLPEEERPRETDERLSEEAAAERAGEQTGGVRGPSRRPR